MDPSSSRDKAIARREKEQKEKAAWWACLAWIASGIYLFASSPAASFFSVNALLFFLVGTFAASLTIGPVSYLVKRSIARLVINLVRSPGPKAAAFVGAIGQVLLIVEVWVAYLAARLVFTTMG
jgi:hypothetical protein